MAPTYFASSVFSLPLKTEEETKGIFTDQELYMSLAAIFNSIYFDIDHVKSYPLRHASHAVAQQLGQAVESNIKSSNSFLSGLLGGSRKGNNPMEEFGAAIIKKLLDSGLGASEITWAQILPAAVAMVPNQAQVVSTSLRLLCLNQR